MSDMGFTAHQHIKTISHQKCYKRICPIRIKKQSDQDLRCLPFYQHLLDALMQCYIKLFLFLGQLWQLFEVSQIFEFLRYC